MKRQQLLDRLESAWADFEDSYAGLTNRQLLIRRVTGEWSVRDIIAHVTWWEQEALKSLPVIRNGEKWPRYSVTYGGVDAFNAMMTEERRHLSLADVLLQHDDVHADFMNYVSSVPEDLYRTDGRFRRRVRFDTYAHYPVHAKAIRAWRARTHNGARR
jgi:hypothetical protein